MLLNRDPLLEEVIICIFGNPVINLAYFFKVDLTPELVPGFIVYQLPVDL